MSSSHLILWYPHLLLPSILPSIRDFFNELAVHIWWPKYWSFSISLSNENSGLISLKIDWSDILIVQGTLRSLSQHHSSKASILSWSAFFYGPALTTLHDYWEDDQYSLVTQSCLIHWKPWTSAWQDSLSVTKPWSLLKLMSIKSVMPSNHLIHCHRLLLLPSIFPSIRVFSNESVLRIRWPKDWSFSFNISPSNEFSGLISFMIGWFDLLTV